MRSKRPIPKHRPLNICSLQTAKCPMSVTQLPSGRRKQAAQSRGRLGQLHLASATTNKQASGSIPKSAASPEPDSRLGISPPPRGNFSAASATTCPKTASCDSPAHVAPYCSTLYRSSDFDNLKRNASCAHSYPFALCLAAPIWHAAGRSHACRLQCASVVPHHLGSRHRCQRATAQR